MKNFVLLVLCVALLLAAQGRAATKGDINFQIRKVATCKPQNHPIHFRGDNDPYCLSAVIVNQGAITSAEPYNDPSGEMGIRLHFTPEAARRLRRGVAVNDEIAVVIDGEPVLRVLVQADISSEVEIRGAGVAGKAELDDWLSRFEALVRKRQKTRKT